MHLLQLQRCKKTNNLISFFCLVITKGGLLYNVSILLLDIFEKWKCDVRAINSW